MRPLPVMALLAACSTGTSDVPHDVLPTPIVYMTVHAWIMEPTEGCYRYRYFQADEAYWRGWITDRQGSLEPIGLPGNDARCYMFPGREPAESDPFFADNVNIYETGTFGTNCDMGVFWDHGVCNGEVPFVLEDWWGWPASLPDGVVPQP